MLAKIIKNFENISKIPHDTFCEKELSDFIVDFAKKNNFYCVQDSFNNVYIKKNIDATKPIVAFQSHLDMVCVKEPNYDIDFKTEPIKLIFGKKYLKAYKTSLGADNGIGVAIIMTLLENCPYNMEAIFTTDEEVSTTGAVNFDYSLVQSQKLISLDGFRANEMIIGCASICDMKLNFDCDFVQNVNVEGYKLIVSNLKGGHSGADIAKNIGNAIKISCEVLGIFEKVQLQDFVSGKQFNFIPNYAEATFVGKEQKGLKDCIDKLKQKYFGLQIQLEKTKVEKVLSISKTTDILNFISKTQSGVLVNDSKGVILSQNLAFININDGLIKLSQRSVDEKLESENIEKIKELSQKYNFKFSIFDKKPGFLTDENCKLVKDLSKQSIKTNKITLKKSVKHVSLEECVFQSKMPYAQMVVVSPKIEFPHSTKERVLLSSVEKNYNLLVDYLKSINN